MNNKFALISGIFLVMLLGTYLNWNYCCRVELAQGSTGTSSNPPANPLVLADQNGSFKFRSDENFNFYFSDYKIVPPLGEDIRRGIDSLKIYLDSQPGRYLEITGLYQGVEGNSSSFANLGSARSVQVRNYMVARGVDPGQLKYSGKEAANLVAYDSMYLGPLEFVFNEFEEAVITSPDSLAAALREDPLVIRFEWGESVISLSEEQREKLKMIARYLSLSEQHNCRVIGHTDNTSSTRFNNALGLKRANFVRDYLVSQGIPEARIEVMSKGETEPVAGNDSEEGRALNRRTVITITE